MVTSIQAPPLWRFQLSPVSTPTVLGSDRWTEEPGPRFSPDEPSGPGPGLHRHRNHQFSSRLLFWGAESILPGNHAAFARSADPAVRSIPLAPGPRFAGAVPRALLARRFRYRNLSGRHWDKPLLCRLLATLSNVHYRLDDGHRVSLPGQHLVQST